MAVLLCSKKCKPAWRNDLAINIKLTAATYRGFHTYFKYQTENYDTINYWTLFWTAFGAIGGTLSAIATTAAVIVALWQTKYANRKKIKVEFNVIRFVKGCFAVKCYRVIALSHRCM